MIGERIRKRRNELGLSLRDLAESINMTAGYLSRVENEQISPSLDALQTIAKALKVPMFYFLNSNPIDPVVRENARRVLYFPDSKIGYELLTPDLTHQMMAVMIRIDPGAKRVAIPLASPNEQWMYVIEGCLEINIDNEIYTLNRGDSIYYDGNRLTEFASVGQEQLVLACCIIPPVF